MENDGTLWRIVNDRICIAGRSLVVNIVKITYLDKASFAENEHVLEI